MEGNSRGVPNSINKQVLDAGIGLLGIFVRCGMLSLLKSLRNYLETEMKLRYY
jgi:hypothetical protein